MWRLVLALKLAAVQTWALMGNCQGAEPAALMFPVMPSFRENSVAPFVPSPPAAGKIPHLLVTNHCSGYCGVLFYHELNSFSRSSPGEARESQAVEGERLGKRVRKKRKIYMDSGDEEEDNQEELEVNSIHQHLSPLFLTSRATGHSVVVLICYGGLCYILYVHCNYLQFVNKMSSIGILFLFTALYLFNGENIQTRQQKK